MAHTRSGLGLRQNEAKNPKDRFHLRCQSRATALVEMLQPYLSKLLGPEKG